MDRNVAGSLTRPMDVELAQSTGRFAGYERLTVRQRKKWLEILLNFEQTNEYDVWSGERPVLHVAEEGRGLLSLLKRIFLGPMRPFTATVSELDAGLPVLKIRRPWRWFYHRLEVMAPGGRPLGAIERQFTLVRRVYRVLDGQGREVATLFGPVLRPWTFEVRIGTARAGILQKRWSGLATELLTDADNFAIDLSGVGDPAVRALLLAATVLIDVVHFERSKGS